MNDREPTLASSGMGIAAWIGCALALILIGWTFLNRSSSGSVRNATKEAHSAITQPAEILKAGSESDGDAVVLQPFLMKDVYGAPVQMDEAPGVLHVVAVLGIECPLVNLYASRLSQLAKEYESKGVRFLAINSNAQDSLTEIARWAKEKNLTFPILRDTGHALANQLRAERTPEVLVLDRTRRVRYRGRIDDQFGIGTVRPAPTREDLRIALDELLAGGEVSQPVQPAPGCRIGRAAEPSNEPTVTFTGQVAEILKVRCVMCHQEGEIGPFPLTDYEEVAGWGPMIKEVVSEGRMPPWFADASRGHFANDKRLTEEEKSQLIRWVDEGCPLGEGENRSIAISRPSKEWHIGEPDAVYDLGDQPFSVPAKGDIQYQFFTVDPKFSEEKWIQAIEFLPGNRSVVHHAAATMAYPAEMAREEFGFFAFTPGNEPLILPEGKGIPLPPGALLKFQIHYTANGTPTTDHSRIGIKFAKSSEGLDPLIGNGAIGSLEMVIPAGAKHHPLGAVAGIDEDFVLWSIFPHMHVRGRSISIEALFPDGNVHQLLNIPRWDFNWQMTYELAKPVRLPADTLVYARAVFDNSTDNPSNPDPTRDVHWGTMTQDEMLYVMLNGYRAPPDPSAPTLPPDWQLLVEEGSVARVIPTSHPYLIRVQAESKGQGERPFQLVKRGLIIENGARYLLRFKGLSEIEQPMRVYLHAEGSPEKVLDLDKEMTLTKEWKDYEFEFVAPADASSACLSFQFGHPSARIQLGAVRIFKKS